MKLNSVPGLPEESSCLILELFNRLPKGAELILFGSRAKGNFREGSDIDLAIKGTLVTQDDRNQWLRQYEDLYFPWKLDLVIYDSIANPALKEHIDRFGKRLFLGEG